MVAYFSFLSLEAAESQHLDLFRPLMKKARFLTRDWRMVEPKKTGQPKAGTRFVVPIQDATYGSFLK